MISAAAMSPERRYPAIARSDCATAACSSPRRKAASPENAVAWLAECLVPQPGSQTRALVKQGVRAGDVALHQVHPRRHPQRLAALRRGFGCHRQRLIEPRRPPLRNPPAIH